MGLAIQKGRLFTLSIYIAIVGAYCGIYLERHLLFTFRNRTCAGSDFSCGPGIKFK